VTADYAIKLLRPTPTDGPVHLVAKVVDSTDDRATISHVKREGEVCATCRGTFVAVQARPPGVPSVVIGMLNAQSATFLFLRAIRSSGESSRDPVRDFWKTAGKS